MQADFYKKIPAHQFLSGRAEQVAGPNLRLASLAVRLITFSAGIIWGYLLGEMDKDDKIEMARGTAGAIIMTMLGIGGYL